MFSIMKKVGALILIALVGYLWESHSPKLAACCDKIAAYL